MWDCKNYFRWSSSWEVWPELAMPCWCHWIVFKNRIQILKCTLLQCRHNSEASAGEACRMCVILCMPILVAPRVNYRSLNGRDYFPKFRRTRLFTRGIIFEEFSSRKYCPSTKLLSSPIALFKSGLQFTKDKVCRIFNYFSIFLSALLL